MHHSLFKRLSFLCKSQSLIYYFWLNPKQQALIVFGSRTVICPVEFIVKDLLKMQIWKANVGFSLDNSLFLLPTVLCANSFMQVSHIEWVETL
jgi:hypothetical protein